MSAKFTKGDQAYILVSNQYVESVTVISVSYGRALVKLASGGAIRISSDRLYSTEEEDVKALPADISAKKETQKDERKRQGPYAYWH